VIQGAADKLAAMEELLNGLTPEQVCYVGDDLPDVPVLRAAGLAACPADAVSEVKDVAHFITNTPGGRGVIREIIEVILKAQGRWNGLISDAFIAPAG